MDNQNIGFYFVMISLILVCCFSVFSLASEKNSVLNLMPVPEKIVPGDGKFRLDQNFTISVHGKMGSRLYKGASRVLTRLAARTGFFFPREYITPQSSGTSGSLQIRCQREGKIKLNEDESYRLTVTPGKIYLAAATDIGVLHGVETFLQLLSVDEQGYYFPALTIEDKPRFPWRGLMIDACRHFMPVEVIKRNLDGMAAVKMNVLHWHLSEDQGFRVECKTFPKLHELGSDGFYYTQTQIREIIDYAADRGIRVMPEFDIPGHATSWFVGYPQYASAPGPYTIERKWGIMDPVFNPAIEATYKFFDAFFKEMTGLFPDEFMHIGGDENNGKQWNNNPEIQAFMKKNNIPDNHALQSYFNQRILKILTKYNKKMIGWDEIFQPDMPTNIVIHSWRGREAMEQSAIMCYQTILSNGYYIDLIQPSDFHYLNDPIPEDSPLTDKQKKFILGGEATMWSEFVGPETVDSRIWPRTAAIAERFWSPGSVRDVDDMYRRMEIISFMLENLGLTHEKNHTMMLRRLANNQNITPLKTLIDVIEPVKRYRRNALRPHTSFSPMTRVIDAAKPDAQIARNFRKLVDLFLSDKNKNSGLLSEITEWLHLWQVNHKKLQKTIALSPVLIEIEPQSANLNSCADIGLQAIEYIQKGQKPPQNWLDIQSETIKKIKQPVAQTELMILSAIEKLVKKAGKSTG